jgi:23S rRNA (pseudouridine1915-N3)-methyltransferase
VPQGFGDYQKRMSHWLPLELVEVEPGQRGKGRDLVRAVAEEGMRVLAAVPRNCHAIALDLAGKGWTSEQLAQRLEHWRGLGRELAKADERWSLGPLTLPYMLVRLLVAEQLYRAASQIANHPYHRA